METTYTLTGHGVIKLGKLLRLDPDDEIHIYTPIGETLYCAKSPWPNMICDSVAPPWKPRTSKSSKYIPPLQTFSDCFYEMEFWSLTSPDNKIFKKTRSGVKNCYNNSIVINIDKDYPEGILLSEVLRIIKDDNRGPISLHLLCCMDIEPKAYYKEEKYSEESKDKPKKTPLENYLSVVNRVTKNFRGTQDELEIILKDISKSYKESKQKHNKTYAEVVKTKPKISWKDDEPHPEEPWIKVTRTMSRRKLKNKGSKKRRRRSRRKTKKRSKK